MNREATNRNAERAEANAGIDTIESILAANRAALDRTLSELEQRISMGGLVNLAMGRLRNENGTEFLRNLRDSVVQNPLPITLAAIGLAWTAFSEGNGRSGSAGMRFGNAQEKAGDMAHRARGTATEAREGGAQRLDAAKARGREWADRGSEALGSVRERADEFRYSAAERTRRSMEQSRDLARENPIIVAGAGLALGAALAALLPATQIEREKLGPARDRAMRQAQEVAAAAGQGAKEGAGDGGAAGRDQWRQTEAAPLGTSDDGSRGGSLHIRST